MSTRGITGFILDNKQTGAYSRSDSYFDGLGFSMVEQSVEILKYFDSYLEKARTIKIDKDIDNFTLEFSGDLLGSLNAGKIEDEIEFAGDSLFCEYGYFFNFDNKTLEVYKGYQHKPNNDRFAHLPIRGSYHPIKLVRVVKEEELLSGYAFEDLLKEEEEE